MKLLLKTHNKFSNNFNQSKHLLKFGTFGIKVLENYLIEKSKLDSLHFILIRKFKNLESKKKIKVWNYLILNYSLTKLPLESRMGKGKGAIFSSGIFLNSGNIIFEFSNINLNEALEIFFCINKKISIKLKLIQK
uniref:ribosomal protein L16 n=1 Tax=Griffithsia okiensis TaxID=291168 RepID=UPI002E7A269F|nr:ribosomal protein L16 [Griffithsia okiensis]WQF69529.1 ribosomal protein L16 [Griffithsia okiensis]